MEILQKLSIKTDSKIVMIVADGLGGISKADRPTELEAANTPNLDRIAKESITGQMDPVRPGITPGSGPGHLGLFGYDPLVYDIGRGILSALGVNFEIQAGDVAARVNFATIDDQGVVTDRRAGRISTEKCVELCEELSKIEVEGVKIFVRPEKEHRAAVIFRGANLSGNISDSDPQRTGEKPQRVEATDDQDPNAEATAQKIRSFIDQAFKILSDHHPANAILMRGFDVFEALPSYQDVYKLNPACIAVYPMYKGVSRLVGMEVIEEGQESIADEFKVLKNNWDKYDFFFVHVKKTDSYGEDGNYDARVKIIEELDREIPAVLDLNPDVLIVTADHSTPSDFKAHSFHPVPTMIRAETARVDDVEKFGERYCVHGGLGCMASKNLMALAMAHAGKLEKFGA
jgi:2,3-bisphosphoglycerate-independent phosphoglycerate mutase